MGFDDHAWISKKGLMFGDKKIIGKWTDPSHTKLVVKKYGPTQFIWKDGGQNKHKFGFFISKVVGNSRNFLWYNTDQYKMGLFVCRKSGRKIDVRITGVYENNRQIGIWIKDFEDLKLSSGKLIWFEDKAGYGFYKEKLGRKSISDWFPCENGHLGTFKIEYEDIHNDQLQSMLYDFDS